MLCRRWAVADIPDNGEPPVIIETFFLWASAIGRLAYLEIFHLDEYSNLEVIRL